MESNTEAVVDTLLDILGKLLIWRGAGGLETRVKIQDQMQWDGQGSPSEAVEKSAPPTNNTALTLTDYKLIDCVMCLCMCVCTCSLGAWKSSLQAKGFPVKIRSINQSINQSGC